VKWWCTAQGLARGAVLTIEQVWRFAQLWYGDCLSPGFRRPTGEEAQAILARAGLTGDFWRLG